METTAMRKVFSIILKAIAGLFFCVVSLLAFINVLPTGIKLGMLLVLLFFAVATLAGGLALTRLCNWKRDTGIVLFSASGYMVFLVFTFACLLMTAEFREMLKPNTLALFSDYLTGSGTIVSFAVLGWLFLKRRPDIASNPDGFAAG
jgi:hypothetical protein